MDFKIFLFATLVTAMTPSMAQQDEARRTSAIYLNSRVYEKVAPVCSSRLPDFDQRFHAAWPHWLEHNAADIDKGAQFLRADAATRGQDFTMSTAATVHVAVSRLQSATQANFLAACNAVIRDVES